MGPLTIAVVISEPALSLFDCCPRPLRLKSILALCPSRVVKQVARAKASERIAIEGTLKQLESASSRILQGCDPKDAYIN